MTMPPVCASVTKMPRATASVARPRVPTRYAAATVLPWPGVAACTAPSQKLDRRYAAPSSIPCPSACPQRCFEALHLCLVQAQRRAHVGEAAQDALDFVG